MAGGSAVVARLMAEQLGDSLHLCSPALTIHQDDRGVTVGTNESEFSGTHVIVTIPQHLIGGIQFEPGLPGRRAQLVQSVPMGAVVKAVARYDRPFWRTDGLSGSAVSLEDPVSVVFDNSPPDGSAGMLVGFFEGSNARTATAMSTSQREGVLIKCLTKLFGPRAEEAEEVVQMDWTAEAWTGGCYGGHLAPGAWTQLGSDLRRPHGRVEWAGSETSPVWNGYMDGAVRSGEAAADRVLAALG